MARIFGMVMIVLVSAWDVDAMRPHIAAHSWYTLAFVALFLAAHLVDYLTVGRLIHRFDPLIFAKTDGFAPAALFLVENGPAPARISFPQVLHAAWQRLFVYQQPPSLLPRRDRKALCLRHQHRRGSTGLRRARRRPPALQRRSHRIDPAPPSGKPRHAGANRSYSYPPRGHLCLHR